ncbi:MAG: hypothetical protein WC002_06105 [Candidatus Muiribacteriota bacterium]
MKKIINLFLISLYIFTCSAKLLPENFLFKSETKSDFEIKNIYFFELNDEILQKSENKGNDIRLYDNNNIEIPYSIIVLQGSEAQKSIERLLIQSYTKNENSTVIELESKSEKQITKIMFNTASSINFYRDVKIEGINSKNQRKLISEDSIYDYSGEINFRKQDIDIQTEEIFKKLIVTLSENQNIKINVPKPAHKFSETENIQIIYFEKNDNFKISSIDAQIKQKDNFQTKNHSQKIEIISNKIEKNISEIQINPSTPLLKIKFDIENPFFYRNITILYKSSEKASENKISGQIYKLAGEGVKDKLEIEFSEIWPHENITLKIDNGDNPPLQINNIEIERLRRRLYFSPTEKSEKILVAVGNKDVNKPSYDITRIITSDNYRKLEAREVFLTEWQSNSSIKRVLTEENFIEENFNIILKIIILIAAGVMVYTLIKKSQ